MNNRYWLPRILSILWIGFVSVFALDEWGNWMGLAMHLVPSMILVIITMIAWKNEKLGGIIFGILGLAMGVLFHSVLISFPMIGIGILFWVFSR